MTKTETATIEVLTAQVRVLMVGSRQVTLSVFRQLDVMHYRSCRPMGRVNDHSRHDLDPDCWIIGVHKNSGELVRARFREVWGFVNWDSHYEIRQELKDGSPIPFPEDARWKKRPDREYLRRNAPDWEKAYLNEWEDYLELPLIILAGLK